MPNQNSGINNNANQQQLKQSDNSKCVCPECVPKEETKEEALFKIETDLGLHAQLKKRLADIRCDNTVFIDSFAGSHPQPQKCVVQFFQHTWFKGLDQFSIFFLPFFFF